MSGSIAYFHSVASTSTLQMEQTDVIRDIIENSIFIADCHPQSWL